LYNSSANSLFSLAMNVDSGGKETQMEG